MATFLDSLQVGDRVTVIHGTCNDRRETVHTVDRVTKTQIRLIGFDYAFNRATGLMKTAYRSTTVIRPQITHLHA